jgi:hypothetical protein
MVEEEEALLEAVCGCAAVVPWCAHYAIAAACWPRI